MRSFCAVVILVLLAAIVLISDAAVPSKRPSTTNRLRRPVSSAGKPVPSSRSRNVSVPANKTAKTDLTPPVPAAAGKKPVPASSRRAVPEKPDDPLTKLAEDMEKIEQLSDPTTWEDDFNDLDPLASPSVMMSNNVLDDPFADYEDFLFDDYEVPKLPEIPSMKKPSSSAVASSGRYLQSEVCGQKFFCRRGDRGPCQPNEVFTPLPNTSLTATTTVITKPTCTNLISYPWNGCLPSNRVSTTSSGHAPKGCCSIRFPQRPCFGYPPSYRFSPQARRCYPCSTSAWNGGVMSSGPCAPNKIFVDIDGINGMCRCRDRNQLLSKTDDRCHRVYSKGPCGDGQWLEPDSNGYGVCRRSPCPADKCDGRHIYWRPTPDSTGGCFKSFTRGPCRRGSYFLVEDYATRRGRCVSQYGSSFNPIRSPSMRYPYGGSGMMSNRLSPWSNFGMYPPFGLFTDLDFGDADYDELNWDY